MRSSTSLLTPNSSRCAGSSATPAMNPTPGAGHRGGIATSQTAPSIADEFRSQRRTSELDLRTELELARGADDRRNLPRRPDKPRRIEHRRRRQSEIHAVGDVEAFRAE